MTPPKRWYQLSMLQLLVAMAVVASVVSLNLPVSRKVGTGRRDDGQEMTFFVTEAGWPLLFVSGFWSTTTQAWLEQPPVGVDLQDIDFVVLFIDLLIDCALLTAVLWVTRHVLASVLMTARANLFRPSPVNRAVEP